MQCLTQNNYLIKKSFFLGLLCLLSIASLAAEEYDLIITTDRARIPCTILEISDVAIRYTRTDRPQTITFSTPLRQVYAIVYRDGTIEQISAASAPATIDTVAATASTVARSTETPIARSTATTTSTAEPAHTAKTTKAAPTTSSGDKLPGRIYRDKNEYIYNDHYISEKEVGRVLQTDALAYDSWQRAHRLYTGGIVATSVGGGIALIGLCCIPASVGAGLGVAGGGLVVSCVGVGLLCGSLGRYEHSIDIFNDHVDARLQVSFFASPSDVGLAMRF